MDASIKNKPLGLPYPPYSRWVGKVRYRHAWSILEGETEGTERDRRATGGSLICSPIFELALEWLVDYVTKEHGGGRPRILIGSTNHCRSKTMPEWISGKTGQKGRGNTKVTGLMETLQSLVEHGTRERIVCQSHAAYVEFMQSNFDKILLPYVRDDGHILVVEIEYTKKDGHIRIWDTVGAFRGCAIDHVVDVMILLYAFFKEGQTVEEACMSSVTCNAAPLNSEQEGASVYSGSAAFAFYVMAHLVNGEVPYRTGPEDEGFMRNYMWACIRQGKLLPLPRIKFVN